MLKSLRPPSPDSQTDEQLLADYLRSGNARQLGALYERYMPMVYGVCLHILKDKGKAEDAVMNIYEELTRKLHTHKVEAFRGWLYVLARNHCIMEWRKNQRRPTDLYDPEDMSRYDAVEPPFETELRPHTEPLKRCLKTLNDMQRSSIEMFYFEEKTYKDIATQLQEDVGKIRSHIQNGRRNLRICMEKVEATQR